jgi:hypothetical protein
MEDDNGRSDANMITTFNGWYIRCEIGKRFWNLTWENQIRALIHEHVHACMIPYDQQVDWALLKTDGEEKRKMLDEVCNRGRELAVAHLESVFFDLFHDKL